MTTNLLELRPDRQLLDHNFEGYKLDLQSLPHVSYDLASAVDRVYPDEVQYSFIHAKLFALHNHLVSDQWDFNYNYYYIDVRQQVRKIYFDDSNNSFHSTVVYDVPAHVERKPGHFNLCLSFASPTIALISDGTGYLHIAETGTRSSTRQVQWQTQHSSLTLGTDKFFIIVDSKMQVKNGKELLHCLIQSVEQHENQFDSVLTWVTFQNDDHQTWKQTSMKQLEGKGIIHYAAIEPDCNALYLASDNAFKFTSDSENGITEPTVEEPRTIIYTWLQTSEDITITLKLEAGFDKNLMHVSITPMEMKVSYAGKTFVDGKLPWKVDSELTTWNLQDNGQVDILITKSESMLWDDLLVGGDKNGIQIMDASLVEDAHRRLAHLCSETEVLSDQSVPGFSTQELEECDAASEEDTVLVRMDANTHKITHRAPLSVHQYLFSINLTAEEAPALVLRHDVDACVWQPHALSVDCETWPLKHKGTLMAFGYVQSSKENRKFVTCPTNFSYSVVCESSKHIFIYKSNCNRSRQIRRRTGGVMRNIKVGQQFVFNIDKYGEVIGIHASKEYLFILTENRLLSIKILQTCME